MNSEYMVYIVIDDNNYMIPEYDGIVKIIKINNLEAESNGYRDCILSLKNKAGSRDKALYYFNRNSIDYNFIWFVEEDVFIPSIQSIKLIDSKYLTHDLLSASNHIIYEKHTDWLWKTVNSQISLDLPYACSMICAIRCSKKMLQSIDNYVMTYNRLFLDEALFNTLAIHDMLDIACPKELSSITYCHKWTYKDIISTKLYHPVKSIDQQYKFRHYLETGCIPDDILLSDQSIRLTKSNQSNKSSQSSQSSQLTKRSVDVILINNKYVSHNNQAKNTNPRIKPDRIKFI
jgi:hypothetical protein